MRLHLGDILHALPAATAIRAALPNSTIGWLVEERWSELLTAQGRKASPNTVSPQKPVVNTVHPFRILGLAASRVVLGTVGATRIAVSAAGPLGTSGDA